MFAEFPPERIVSYRDNNVSIRRLKSLKRRNRGMLTSQRLRNLARREVAHDGIL